MFCPASFSTLSRGDENVEGERKKELEICDGFNEAHPHPGPQVSSKVYMEETPPQPWGCGKQRPQSCQRNGDMRHLAETAAWVS